MAPQGDSTNAKQMIVGRIQQATNIMVAVGANPSIDALSAALALSLMLNKLDKHATAVFSGQVPAVMQFLNPEKTFENNVDSLRDFIISLDREKADRLRYKLEKDVVRIFITPYRTTINQSDLQFSQGDFNVDLVIALGVEKRDDLDKAVIAHGRILHDAAVVTINSNGQQSNLGAVDWHDPNSSSLCEMLVSLTEALQKPGLLDAQIANALLTGIVAATDRFSNQHTTPRVMTMSAQLMAAGANQQLVAINVQKPAEPQLQAAPAEEPDATVGADGELSIKHVEEDKPKDVPVAKSKAKEPEQPEEAEQTPQPEPEDTSAAEAELDKVLPKTAEVPDVEKSLSDLEAQLKDEMAKPEPAVKRGFVHEAPTSETQEESVQGEIAGAGSPLPEEPMIRDERNSSSWRNHRLEPPTLGGSLSSTSEEALEDSLKVEEDTRNHQILSHEDAAEEPSAQPASTEIPQMPAGLEEPPTLSPATPPAAEPVQPTVPEEPADGGVDDAREAVNSALVGQEFNPAGMPRQDVGAQQLGADSIQPYIPLEPATPPAMPSEPAKPAGPPTDANGLPIIPPMPALPTEDPSSPGLPPMPPPLPPLPGEQPPPPPPTPGATPPTDPGQFKIPS